MKFLRLLILLGAIFAAAIGLFVSFALSTMQRADSSWRPQVAQPTFTSNHPRVIIDQAHWNAHRAGGKYRPFARLLEADGYRVVKGRTKLSAQSLREAQVLIIVNAAGGGKPQILGINIPYPTKKKREMPAFTASEIQTVRAWVKQGGSLLLIADHAPFGAAADSLAAAFGVRMNCGFVEVPDLVSDPLLFSGDRLGDHPIIAGEGGETSVRRVMTFTGQSLDGPSEATVLLHLPDSAVEYVPSGAGLEFVPRPAGKAQALALEFGQGRVVILGEAGMLTAQVFKGERFGMNLPGNDNRTLALNIMHWLSHTL